MEAILTLYPIMLITIIVLSVAFRKGNKRLLWFFILIYLIFFGHYLKVIGAISTFSLPEGAIVKGINFPHIPTINGLIVLLLSFPLIFLCRKEKIPPTDQPSSKRWLWLGLGVCIIAIAYVAFLSTVFTPNVVGSVSPNPKLGVILNLSLTPIGAFLLYYASKFNTPTKPNALRWLSFLIVIIFSFSTLSLMMILIFAVPGEVATTYPFLAGILSLNITFFSLTAVGLAKDFVPKNKTENV